MGKIITKLITPNRYSRPQVKLRGLKGIVIHWVANPKSTAMGNRNYFDNLKNQTKTYASAHEVIDLNGDVVICIPNNEVAFHVGSKTYTKRCLDKFGNSPNMQTYGIEFTHLDLTGEPTKETYDSLIERCVDLCIEHKLNPLTDIWTHEEIVGWKDCPRYYSKNPSEWVKFKNLVNNQLKERMNTMVKIENVDEALKVLVDNKVISSPNYWKTASNMIKYFDVFILNVANKLNEMKGGK